MGKRKSSISKKKVLDKQKPKRKLRLFRLRRQTALLTAFIATSYATYRYYDNLDLIKWSQLAMPGQDAKDIQLTIFPELEKEDEKSVRYLFKDIDDLNRSELELRLKQAQKLLSAKAISMIQIRPMHFALFIEFHTPKFAIDLGTPRFVNAKGQVYGFFKEGQHSWLPILRGLKLTGKPEFLDDQTMVLDHETKTVVNEALLLFEQSLSYNITYRDLYFDPYRGFRGYLSNHRISVELGREPFETRLGRFRKILDDLTQKGISSAHVELDFQDKAFVRELGT